LGIVLEDFDDSCWVYKVGIEKRRQYARLFENLSIALKLI
jgi:hypothetical protein